MHPLVGNRGAKPTVEPQYFMSTIQLAINDPAYARWIRSLLLRYGAHQVHVMDWPELKLDGVIVIDKKRFDTLSLAWHEVRRFLVIAPNDYESACQLWNAGVKHVVFEGDSPAAAALAILALDLNLFQRDEGSRNGASGW
jgi:hypothetical protein